MCLLTDLNFFQVLSDIGKIVTSKNKWPGAARFSVQKYRVYRTAISLKESSE